MSRSEPSRPAPRRADFPVHRRITTRWSDEDVYGHVNNVTYYAYFDTAVNGYLMAATGTDIRRLPTIGLVAETSCEFRRPLGFPDDVEAALGVERRGPRSVVWRIGLFQGDDQEPAALGRFVHVYVDAQTRRPVAVPEVVRAVVDPIAEQVDGD
ncbi:MAG: acyl-CoA thioesterase [Nocardioidaceae bacterium]